MFEADLGNSDSLSLTRSFFFGSGTALISESSRITQAVLLENKLDLHSPHFVASYDSLRVGYRQTGGVTESD